MSSVDANFTLPLEANSYMNKGVNNLRNGEWMEYRDIYFTGDEYEIYVDCRGLLAGAKLLFYIDSTASGNQIASYTLATESAYSYKTIKLSKTIPAGAHKVYVKVTGTAGKNLAHLDYFTFIRDAGYW